METRKLHKALQNAATINLGEAFTVEQIKDRSIVIDGDIGEVLEELLKC